ncbi:MAG: tetratricopeptide repeat protein [Candidatus Poribacteria bacterium]|nr:tetratricopeptide repeat protein [Candidatus Poribacteria bacterium]
MGWASYYEDTIEARGESKSSNEEAIDKFLDRAETAAKKVLSLWENNDPDSQKLLEAIKHYRSDRNFLDNSEWNLESIFTVAHSTHYKLGQVNFEEGKLEEAKSAAEETLKLRDEYPPAQKLLADIKMRYYNNGKIYFNPEEYTQAIFKFQKQVDSNCELAKELLQKIKQKHKEHGDDYRKKNAFTKALKSYQQAIRIDDKYKEAYHNLGILYRKMKRYDEAIKVYKKAIDLDEISHVTYSDFSFVYREIGETATAVDLLKRAIAIKPDYQRAYYNLADTYFEIENLQDASEKVLEALRLDDNDQDTLKLQKNIVHAYLKQGRDYFRQGNLTAAETSAKEALTLDPNYQPVQELLTEIKDARNWLKVGGAKVRGLVCWIANRVGL